MSEDTNFDLYNALYVITFEYKNQLRRLDRNYIERKAEFLVANARAMQYLTEY